MQDATQIISLNEAQQQLAADIIYTYLVKDAP